MSSAALAAAGGGGGRGAAAVGGVCERRCTRSQGWRACCSRRAAVGETPGLPRTSVQEVSSAAWPPSGLTGARAAPCDRHRAWQCAHEANRGRPAPPHVVSKLRLRSSRLHPVGASRTSRPPPPRGGERPLEPPRGGLLERPLGLLERLLDLDLERSLMVRTRRDLRKRQPAHVSPGGALAARRGQRRPWRRPQMRASL